jgi:hypothetical protein
VTAASTPRLHSVSTLTIAEVNHGINRKGTSCSDLLLSFPFHSHRHQRMLDCSCLPPSLIVSLRSFCRCGSMAQKSFALRRRTPTTSFNPSFNPYREPTAQPRESDTTPQQEAALLSSAEFSTRIGLGAGLSAFILAAIALFVYGWYHKSQRHRLRQELGAQGMTERNGAAAIVAETPRSPEGRVMSEPVADTAEARPKQPVVHVNMHMDGHGQGESSSSGGNLHQAQEPIPEGSETHGRKCNT